MLPKQTFWNTKKTVVCRNMHCQHIFWRLSCAPSLSSFGHDASVWEKYHGAVSSVVLPSSRVQSSLQAKSSLSSSHCPGQCHHLAHVRRDPLVVWLQTVIPEFERRSPQNTKTPGRSHTTCIKRAYDSLRAEQAKKAPMSVSFGV